MDAELRRSGPLGRFPARTEDDYQDWAINESLPIVRAIAWVSVVIWIIGPFMPVALLDTDAPLRAWLVAWAVNIPVLLLALAAASRQPRVWMAAAPLVLITLDSLLILDWMEVDDEPLIMVAMTAFYLYLAPVMKFPVRATAVILAAVIPTTVVWAIRTADHAGTWNGTLNFMLWLLGATSAFALVMAWVTENGSRQQYVDKVMLARQQELLESSRALIRRYAPPSVAERLEHGDTTVDSAQRRRVTIFFADVVGFTSLADRIDPEALAEIVNEYLGSVAQIIERHGGTLNEFAGDGVMAIFGAPDELEPRDQVLAALASARELQSSLPEWSRRWYILGIDQDLQARIGINTGVVSIGTFGSAVRATYTGIGLQTNIAARIQTRCPPGSVLLSKTSWHLISDTVPCEPRGEVEVKGVHYPIAMYEPS